MALFFGLSRHRQDDAVGRPRAAADRRRRARLERPNGVFNFEGGCYAKVIRLSPKAEPEIYESTRRFGTILENVRVDIDTRRVDLDDATLTENTRAALPDQRTSPMPAGEGRAGHPRNVILLTADAFGVLPPVAKLTPEQAMYHFLSGYTAKVAGTERGIVEPKATFSACFGAPFMAQHPKVYAEMLGQKIARHGVTCWLVNTGWTGGPYGAGSRMKIAYTRATITAALAGKLDEVPFVPDPVFGVLVPLSCPGVPSEVLAPRGTWPDPAAYDAQASLLAGLFRKNFQQFDGVTAAVRDSGPTAR